MALNRTSKVRVDLLGWPRGLFQSAGVDSSRINKQFLDRAMNCEIDETGGLFQRKGITVRAAGLPSPNTKAWFYRKGTSRAIIGSDGTNIYRLTNAGWGTIGTFSSGGNRASASLADGRLYVVNGASRPKVVEDIGGTFNVRDAGVDPPVNAPTISPAGGSGTAVSLRYAISYVDDRGFESNIGPVAQNDSVLPGATVTIGRNNTPPANVVSWNVYGSLQNLRSLFFIKSVPVSNTSTTTDTLNLSRDEGVPAPTKNTVPPTGIFSLYFYRRRMYAARFTDNPTFYGFSELDNVEAFPIGNFEDLSYIDGSAVQNFIPVAHGLLVMKEHSIMLLEGDPVFESTPRPVLEHYGLVHPDAFVSVAGVAIMLCRPGLVAHDGLRSQELFRRLPRTSADFLTATVLDGVMEEREGSIFAFLPSKPGKVLKMSYEPGRKIFKEAEFTTTTATSVITDSTLDFSDQADIVAHQDIKQPTTVTSKDDFFRTVVHGADPVPPPYTEVPYLDWRYADAGGTRTVLTRDTQTGGGEEGDALDGAVPAIGVSLSSVLGTKVEDGKLTRTNWRGPANSTAYNDFVMSKSPAAYWKLDDPAASSTATDSSGNGRHGTHTGTTRERPSLLTNSSTFSTDFPPTGFVQVSNPPHSLTGFTNGLSVVGWVNLDTRPPNNNTGYVVKKRSGGNVEYELRFRTDGAGVTFLEFVVTQQGGATFTTSGIVWNPSDATQQLLTTGVTHFLAGTYHFATNTLAVMFDGKIRAFINPGTPITQVADFGTSLRIGDNETDGRIDEVALFGNGLDFVDLHKMYRFGSEAVGSKFYASDPVMAYSAVTKVKNDFVSFISFANPAITASWTEVPGQSKVRAAVRFEDASPIFSFSSWKSWNGSAWVPLTGEPTRTNDNGAMTMTALTALTDAELRGPGGINLANPKIQFRFWLSGTSAAEASVDNVVLRYNSSAAAVSCALRLSDDTDIGAGNLLTAGRYIFNTTAGYKLNDGEDDAGNPIECDVVTEQVAPVQGDVDMYTNELDIESGADQAEVEVFSLVNGKATSPKVGRIVDVDFGRKTYEVGADPDTVGMRHSTQVKWRDRRLKLHGLGLILEARGRSTPT